jgi:cytochrome c biogenesis factor
MLIPSSIALIAALVSVFLSTNTNEEMVRVAGTGLAAFFAFLSLIFLPWPLKLTLVILPFLSDRIPGFKFLGSR